MRPSLDILFILINSYVVPHGAVGDKAERDSTIITVITVSAICCSHLLLCVLLVHPFKNLYFHQPCSHLPMQRTSDALPKYTLSIVQ